VLGSWQNLALNARYWKKLHKNAEATTNLAFNLDQGIVPTVTFGVKYLLADERSQSGRVVLTANAGTDYKTSIELQKHNSNVSQNISSAFQQTNLSGSFDHKNQEYKVGLQMFFQY
jgi:hypothetical protein